MMASTALSLGKAARAAGVGKATLARAIRSGRLGATRTATGYLIEPCELERAGYALRAPTEAQDATDGAPGGAGPDATANATSATLAGEVAVLREMLAMMREQATDARQERDQWGGGAERAAPAPPQPAPRPEA